MKDYLSAEERNQLMVIASLTRMFTNVQNKGINGPKIQDIADSWASRNAATKEELKWLRSAQTFLEKFFKSVFARMDKKEESILVKKCGKYDFRLIDDYTLQKVYRDMNDKMKYAVILREHFFDWSSEIMECECKDCTKHWKECDLHKVFEDNFVPECDVPLDNCRYAYTLDSSVGEIKELIRGQEVDFQGIKLVCIVDSIALPSIISKSYLFDLLMEKKIERLDGEKNE